MKRYLPLLAFSLFVLPCAAADNLPIVKLTLKNHVYVPDQLSVPLKQKTKLILKNEDPTAAEFESFELNREKVVPANGEITVYLDPLDAGTYPFFDDFHRETKGAVIVK